MHEERADVMAPDSPEAEDTVEVLITGDLLDALKSACTAYRKASWQHWAQSQKEAEQADRFNNLIRELTNKVEQRAEVSNDDINLILEARARFVQE